MFNTGDFNHRYQQNCFYYKDFKWNKRVAGQLMVLKQP